MKILALQLKRLGDLVLTTPALDLLARQGEVTLAVWGAASGLLPAIPGLPSGIVLGQGRGWTPWQQVIWGRFDRVVDFTGSDRSALLTWLSRAPHRVTFQSAKRPWWRRQAYHEFIDSPVREQHTIEHYARLIGEAETPPPRLQVPSNALAVAHSQCQSNQRPYALLHAGTARAEKYWLPERWAEVAAHLHRRHGLRCILTGGDDPHERAHLAAIQKACPVPLLNLAGTMDLLTLTAAVSEARLVLTVDTVTAHLAAAFQRPQIVLFGPTNPFHWRPRHPGTAIFSATAPEAPLTTFDPRQKGAPMERLSTAPIIHATDGLLFP